MRVFYRLFAVLAFICFSSLANADEKVIKIGAMVYEDVQAISLISKHFLEQENYKVEVVNFSETGIAYSALARGDVDLLVSMINYVAYDYWTKNKQRLEKVSVVSHGLLQGIAVPDYMNITSVEELNTVKEQTGGKVIGIEPGSGLMREVGDAVKAYGLQYDVVDGSTAAMAAQLQSALERKQPIAVALWKPSWMAERYNVKFLEDPKHVFAPPQTYYWIAKKGFSAANPGLREAVASIYVPIDDITRMTGAVKGGATMEQAVDNWWKDNQPLAGKWAQMSSK
ncbi:glycine betaine ABC transporter substrate-binding protein [Pseudomonas sp. NPDC090592]|uniref:glycine betaine ABC transporter substrate-binding protein n=1 Tax=Pseudomonas sp. NPDC090592 TaxID=3364480 RepID=UPI00383ABE07